jgi:hypothetical protein
MTWRRRSGLLVASATLFFVLVCGGSSLAVQRGILPAPDINVQLSRHPMIALVAFTTPCRFPRPGTREREQNYVVLLYTPDGRTSWETSGHFLLDMPMRC